MTPAELQALVAAAAPGARITVVMVELPTASAPPAIGAAVPKPVPLPAAAGVQASAIAERTTPFTCAELADVLRVRPDTVGGWCRSGQLPGAMRTGAGWRIPPSAVLAMLAAATPPNTTRPNATAFPPNVMASAPDADPAGGLAANDSVLNGAPAKGAGADDGRGSAADSTMFDPASFGSWRPHRAGGNGAGGGR